MIDVYKMSIFKHFLPCIITGKDAQGNRYPAFQCSTRDLNLTIKDYHKRHPNVVRVIIDLALDGRN